MRRHCAVDNLKYSRAMCVQTLVTLTRRFVRQIPACKKGFNLKTKDLQTQVYMNLYQCFWMYNSPLKFVRLLQNHSVYIHNEVCIMETKIDNDFISSTNQLAN
jgi:hypothetical protein